MTRKRRPQSATRAAFPAVVGHALPPPPPVPGDSEIVAYMDWVARQPSVFGRPGHVELHHHGSSGMGQKCSDWLVVPLTTEEHREYHDTGAIAPHTAEQTRRALAEWQRDSLSRWLERRPT